MFGFGLYVVIGLSSGKWEGWQILIIFSAALFAFWVTSSFVAFVACKRRLVMEGDVLRVTKGGETIYQCPIREIVAVERELFEPFADFPTGKVTVTNFAHPLPDGGEFMMGWLAYRRIKRCIATCRVETLKTGRDDGPWPGNQ